VPRQLQGGELSVAAKLRDDDTEHVEPRSWAVSSWMLEELGTNEITKDKRIQVHVKNGNPEIWDVSGTLKLKMTLSKKIQNTIII
jgi:hypothetical protein